MEKFKKLFEFLLELIDAQIAKYRKLATFGVGPDALRNASLVKNEVIELVFLSESILCVLEKYAAESLLPAAVSNNIEILYKEVLNQIGFYIEQENLRGEAGWLIDDNNIHTGVFNRTDRQKAKIMELAILGKVDITTPAIPVTRIQQQCEHDSNEIAYRILNLAMILRADQSATLDQNIPEHARKILLKHAQNASGRYSDSQLGKRIVQLHTQCTLFLQKSKLSKSEQTLDKFLADQFYREDCETLKKMRVRYKKIVPDAVLFKEEKLESGYSNRFLTSALSLGAIALMAYLTNYLMSSSEVPESTYQIM